MPNNARGQTLSRQVIYTETSPMTGNLNPPWPPGVSGNPAGRPVGKNRATVLRELYDLVIARQDLSGAEAKMPVETAIMQALVLKALSGDVPAIRESQDTVYGKIADKNELTGKDGEKLEGMTMTIIRPDAS